MELIIGGAFQGKETYARAQHPEIHWKNGKELKKEELLKAQGVLDFQEYLRNALKEGENVQALADEIYEKNPDLVLVTQEVGYGVVPVDAFDRQYREAVGRVCTKLASYSDKVTRVVCGIGTVIKHA